jgi:branched-chain amino acid transport system substrate-binding protein
MKVNRKLSRGSACTFTAMLAMGAGMAFAQADGVSDMEIVLGQTADFSASRSVISKAYAEGARLYFDQVNAAGGVMGRKVRIKPLDDKYQVALALENAKELVERQKVFGLVHGVGTAIAESTLKYVEERGIPYIHPLTGADELRNPPQLGKYSFYLRAPYGAEVKRIVAQLNTVNIQRVALVYEDETFGQGIRKLVDQAAQKSAVKITAYGILPAGRPDAVDDAVAAVRRAEPQAVIIGNAGPGVANFLKRYVESGGRSQFYCLSVSNVEQLYKALGAESKNVIVAQVMPSVDRSAMSVVQDYRTAAAKAGSGAGNGFGLEGYISARIIVEGLRNAGRDLTRRKFIDALEAMGSTTVGGFPVRYGPGIRDGSSWVDIAIINDRGRLTY